VAGGTRPANPGRPCELLFVETRILHAQRQ
jgi:hypothetical protein